MILLYCFASHLGSIKLTFVNILVIFVSWSSPPTHNVCSPHILQPYSYSSTASLLLYPPSKHSSVCPAHIASPSSRIIRYSAAPQSHNPIFGHVSSSSKSIVFSIPSLLPSLSYLACSSSVSAQPPSRSQPATTLRSPFHLSHHLQLHKFLAAPYPSPVSLVSMGKTRARRNRKSKARRVVGTDRSPPAATSTVLELELTHKTSLVKVWLDAH